MMFPMRRIDHGVGIRVLEKIVLNQRWGSALAVQGVGVVVAVVGREVAVLDEGLGVPRVNPLPDTDKRRTGNVRSCWARDLDVI